MYTLHILYIVYSIQIHVIYCKKVIQASQHDTLDCSILEQSKIFLLNSVFLPFKATTGQIYIPSKDDLLFLFLRLYYLTTL